MNILKPTAAFNRVKRGALKMINITEIYMLLKQKAATSNEDNEITNTAIRRRLNTTEDLIKMIIRRKLDISVVTWAGLKTTERTKKR